MRVELDVLMRALGLVLLIPLLACHPDKGARRPSKAAKATGPVQGLQPLPISQKAMGPFHLGMTVGELKQAIPGLKLDQSEDGDGVAFLDLTLKGETVLSAYVGEESPTSPLQDPARKVEALETFSAHPATLDGVRVGMTLKEVERIWGPVTEIVWTEIESREFVTFARSPKWLVIRTYGGIYPGEDQTKPTKKYQPDATIHSLAISLHRP